MLHEQQVDVIRHDNPRQQIVKLFVIEPYRAVNHRRNIGAPEPAGASTTSKVVLQLLPPLTVVFDLQQS